MWVQELIVSAAVLGAGVGSAVGGWLSDTVGRKKALLLGDGLFAAGALFMAAAPSASALITGERQSTVDFHCLSLPFIAFHCLSLPFIALHGSGSFLPSPCACLNAAPRHTLSLNSSLMML